jgi:hypothetical protein
MTKTQIIMALILLVMSGCNSQKSSQGDVVLGVDQLIQDSSKYASKIVAVHGEIKMDYHGPVLCDENGTPCFFVVPPENLSPKPDFELSKDHMYEEYKRLYIDIASVQRALDKAKLFSTLRGRFENYILSNGKETIVQNPKDRSSVKCRFVLQRVLELDIRSMEK